MCHTIATHADNSVFSPTGWRDHGRSQRRAGMRFVFFCASTARRIGANPLVQARIAEEAGVRDDIDFMSALNERIVRLAGVCSNGTRTRPC